MSLLLVALPSGPPNGYDYATSRDGQSVAAHGSATAALLPNAGRGVEVVAVVPAGKLSWQRVQLPKGLTAGSPRLRAALSGLLEDQLLDDANQLHFALEPGASGGQPAWVAVCDRAWLQAHLQALESVGRTVNRIVPELTPRSGSTHLFVTGTPGRAQLLVNGDAVTTGVQALPLAPGALALLARAVGNSDTGNPVDSAKAYELFAEPAVAEVAEEVLGAQPVIQQAADRLLSASRTDWDLAQSEFSRGNRARLTKRVGAIWRDLLFAPVWRPARWGFMLLLLAQLVGLNWWAYETRADLSQRRAQIDTVLTQTFPKVNVVVDAPVQMAREVAGLRQATGALSPRDLEPTLSAFAMVAPEGATPSSMEFAAGELRARGIQMAASALAEANQRLRPLGYQMQAEADAVVLRHEGAP